MHGEFIIKSVAMEFDLRDVNICFELLEEVVAYVRGQSIIGKINFDQRFVESKSIGKFLDLVETKIAEFEVQGSQVVILVLHTSAKVVKALET